jgi:hypothetical protein
MGRLSTVPTPSSDSSRVMALADMLEWQGRRRSLQQSSSCQRQTASPQVSPVPKPLMTSVPPTAIRPLPSASHGATGILAVDVLP